MNDVVKRRYNYWLDNLKNISKEDYEILLNLYNSEIEDSFYKDLTFGTGGLRAKMGLGSNRLNVYTIYRATRGLGNNLLKSYKNPTVVIGYDSRINSEKFAKLAANVLANLNINVKLFPTLIPTPVVSFAIRYLKAEAGIIITASHNPKEYNGYKVYNSGANQITLDEAEHIINEIDKVDTLKEFLLFSKTSNSNKISFVDSKVLEAYFESTKKTSVLNDFSSKDLKIVYTPLNGAGIKCVKRILLDCGYKNLEIVKEQENPDGNFPTCPKPNPELKEAMEKGIELTKKTNSDLLIATDPDSDRCGIGVNYNGEIKLLNGNEVAILLFTYLIEHLKDTKGKEIVRSIVSTSLIDKIAEAHHIKVKKVLTGFKYIGEEMNALEKNNKLDDFVLGFEESYGYLTNKDVRDKDAVNAALLIAEMTYFYKKQGLTLIDKLEKIYEKYGYYKSILLTKELDGEEGQKKISDLIQKLRILDFDKLSKLFNEKVIKKEDFLESKEYTKNQIQEIHLPKSNVLIFTLADKTRFMIRPSGTEPKIKCYIEVVGTSLLDSKVKLVEKINDINTLIIWLWNMFMN